MFDIGFAELLIIGVVALVVLGPERLPTAARAAGLWIGRIKRSVSSIQNEISEELRADELRRNIAIQKDELDKELAEMRQPFVPTSTPPTETTAAESSKADKAIAEPASKTKDSI
ncbi:MAG: Sec-independent protein translocase protein TatB [Pontibacterium sp.]